MKMSKNKKLGLILGAVAIICTGVLTVSLAPRAQTSEAAILVHDEENIAQAIEQVIKSASILTEEQKQVAIMILNSKKLDGEVVQKAYDKLVNRKDIFLMHNGDVNSVASVESVFKGSLGDVEKVLNGNMTVVDFYQNTEKRHRYLQEESQKLATEAKKVREEIIKITDELAELEKALAESEGQEQTLEITALIEEKRNQIANLQSWLTARKMELDAAKIQADNAEKAEKEQFAKNTADLNLNNVPSKAACDPYGGR